jgi:hypothetical protein
MDEEIKKSFSELAEVLKGLKADVEGLKKAKEQEEEERNIILAKMKELGVTEEMLNGLGVK